MNGRNDTIDVSIVCITYNHEPFIAQTIEGFLLQIVNFKFEIIIAEDCSTDKTREICKEYAYKHPDLIKLIYSDYNIGAVKNEKRAMIAARGKYIAFCEGDDYWTDALKLQKQYDFLEHNSDYSVCFHRCMQHDTETDVFRNDRSIFNEDKTQIGITVNAEDFLFSKYTLLPLSMMFRNNIIPWERVDLYEYYRDTQQIYHLLSIGKGYLFAFVGAVRNRHNGGCFSALSKKDRSTIAVKVSKELYLYNKNKLTKRYYEDCLTKAMYAYRELGELILAMKTSFLLFHVSHDIIRLGKSLFHNIKNSKL